MHKINSKFGREEGDKFISYAAQAVNEILDKGEIAMRMGNDEFVIASITDKLDENRGECIVKELKTKLGEINAVKEDGIEIGIYYVCEKAAVSNSSDLKIS